MKTHAFGDELEFRVKLTTKGRYAVTAMVDLAAHSNGKPVTLAEIANRQNISLSYLEQLFAKMRRAGLVGAVRGPGGGYRLVRAATETRIADIVRAVDDPIASDASVVQSDAENLVDLVTADLWVALNDHVQRYLNAVSLAHVLERNVILGAQAEGAE